MNMRKELQFRTIKGFQSHNMNTSILEKQICLFCSNCFGTLQKTFQNNYNERKYQSKYQINISTIQERDSVKSIDYLNENNQGDKMQFLQQQSKEDKMNQIVIQSRVLRGKFRELGNKSQDIVEFYYETCLFGALILFIVSITYTINKELHN